MALYAVRDAGSRPQHTSGRHFADETKMQVPPVVSAQKGRSVVHWAFPSLLGALTACML